MRVSVRGTVFVVALLLANNLLWLFLLENSTKPDHDEKITLDIPKVVNSDTVPNGERQRKLAAEARSFEPSNIKKCSNSNTRPVERCACNKETTPVDRHSPFAYDSAYMDVPIEHSREFLYQHAIDTATYFSHADLEKKFKIIDSLSAQGEDLNLIRDILKNEHNSALRIATLSRLKHQHSFTATRALIEALDDPVEEVALTALNTIVTNGDRTLLPILVEKTSLLPDGVVRDEYTRLINRLRFSVTMGMDGIPVD